MNANTGTWAKWTKTLETFYKNPAALEPGRSAICRLSFETQLCDHRQTLAQTLPFFPPCHQMVPLRIDTAAVCLLLGAAGRNGVANDYKTPARGGIRQTEAPG